MRERGLSGWTRKKWRRAGGAAPSVPLPDYVQRDFAPSGPNQLWVADITSMKTWQGWVHLAVVMDCFSRRIVGWATAPHLRTELVLEALEMAVVHRNPDPGLIHHSDRGTQYTSMAFGSRLKRGRDHAERREAGHLLGQHRRRELLRDAEEGAHLPAELASAADSGDGDLRVHRDLLQPPAQALEAR